MRYMFIECQTPDKAKLKNTRGSKSAARAHVTKEFHRKVRLKRRDGFTSTTTAGSASPTTSTPGIARSNSISTIKSEESFTGSTVKYEDEDDDDDEVESLQRIPTRESRSPSVSDPMARSVIQLSLSQSRTDPFNQLPIADMPPFMQRVLDHALVHTWPSTVPVRRNESIDHPVKAAWLHSCMQYPVVFHAFLWAASLQLLNACNGRELVRSAEMMRYDHYQKAITLINKHITELDGPPSDALIMAVTTLAVHGKRAPQPGVETHPPSPMASQQYMNMYGQFFVEESHVNGLKELIQRKGGIDGMHTWGMADTIALADLYLATKRIKPPLLPAHWPDESLVSSGKHTPDPIASAMGDLVGTGFEFLAKASGGEDLYLVLEHMCEVTIALDHHTRRGAGSPEMVDLVIARNSAQHQLLSLPLLEIGEEFDGALMTHICRMATLIYSDMVLFPIPAIQKVKPALALRLKSLLLDWNIEFPCRLRLKLLTWATTLGCIASIFEPEHDWFLQQLNLHLTMSRIQDWPSLRDLCSTFLWWSPVCDPPGRSIWSEAQALKLVKFEHIAHR